MVLQSNSDKLESAWRALKGDDTNEGWRTIPVEMKGNCRLLAGRHFPGSEEAILVGFGSVRIPPDNHLPQGQGFKVDNLGRGVLEGTHKWLSLSRLSAGNIDMFTMMAEDIINILETHVNTNEENLFQIFLGRIKAWQNFMDSCGEGILNTESEIGLYGELVVLKNILGMEIPSTVAIETWQGPLGGLQDFLIGTGAIEVKTTISPTGFIAKINSLEQLDELATQPLFLAGVRLAIRDQGKTLPEFAEEVRIILQHDLTALSIFESRLIHAGLLDAFTNHYTRRFVHVATTVHIVDDMFPKLTRNNIGIEIRKAHYELDLSLIQATGIGLDLAIKQLRGD